MNSFVKGDTIELEITANVDITDWEIRAEFHDKNGSSVKLATANVTGGSNTQISIDNASAGIFTIMAEEGLTTDFAEDSFLEIERVDANGKRLTILQLSIIMKDEQIKWTESS